MSRRESIILIGLGIAVCGLAAAILVLLQPAERTLVQVPTLMALSPPTETLIPTNQPPIVAALPTETALPSSSPTSTIVTAQPIYTETITPTNTLTLTPSVIQTAPSQAPLMIGPGPIQNDPVSGVIVLSFSPQSSAAERAAYIETLGGEIINDLAAVDSVVVRLPEDASAQALPDSPLIVASEPDYYVSALVDMTGTLLPDDPLYPNQWGLQAISAPEAWASLPANSANVVIAVIDSGVCLDHSELSGRLLPGWDFVQSDSVPQDDFGHGCAIAGIIASISNNHSGIAGVAPNARILPLRVLNGQGVGTYGDVSSAVIYAADHGAQVINLSLGGVSRSSLLERAINYAISHGVTVVAAAGNSGGAVYYPAAYPPVIAVGAVDPSLELSGFSSSGPEIDTLAPGRDILSLDLSGGYRLFSGTSFAAPHVAGTAALHRALGIDLILDGSLIRAGAHNTPSLTPAGSGATATPFTLATSGEDALIYVWDSTIYQQSLVSGETLALGQAFAGVESALSETSLDVYRLQDSPLLAPPSDGYGFYHGVWALDHSGFVHLELEPEDAGFRIRAWQNGVQHLVLEGRFNAERGYLDPIAWLDTRHVLLVERAVIDEIMPLRLWSLDIATGELTTYDSRDTALLQGRSFWMPSGAVFLGFSEETSQGFLYHPSDKTVSAFAAPLIRQHETIPAANLTEWVVDQRAFVVSAVDAAQLAEYTQTLQAARLEAQTITTMANRPAPFLYWPLADDKRSISFYPDSPWRLANSSLPTYTGHHGTDIDHPMQTPIYASAPGVVVRLYNGCPNHTQNFSAIAQAPANCTQSLGVYPINPSGFGYHNAGNAVQITHNITVNGNAQVWRTFYGHVAKDSILVVEGQSVALGTLIAGIGHSGKSTGPHLHFELWNASAYTDWDDPWGSADPPYGASLWVGGNDRPLPANGVIILPQNDRAQNAVAINILPFSTQQNLYGATITGDPSMCGITTQHIVWFRYTPPLTTELAIRTEITAVDTVIGVFTGSPTNLQALECDDDDGDGTSSFLRFNAAAGTTYYIAVGKYGSNQVASNTYVPFEIRPANLIANGDFSMGLNSWTTWNATAAVSSGIFNISRNSGSSSGGFYQPIDYVVPPNAVFEMTFNMANLSSAGRAVNVVLRNPEWTESRNCVFTLQPLTPMQNYTIRFKTGMNWSSILMQGWLEPGDGASGLQLDNVSLRYRPELTGVTTTSCVAAPPADSNLIYDGGFDYGLASWAVWNANATANGSLAISRQIGYGSGGFYQYNPYSLPSGAPVEFRFLIRNTGTVARGVHVLVRSPDWVDIYSCWISLPPNTPYREYIMRFTTPRAWTNIIISGWLLDGDGAAGLVFDNMQLYYRPNMSPANSPCAQNGAGSMGLADFETITPSPTPSPTQFPTSTTTDIPEATTAPTLEAVVTIATTPTAEPDTPTFTPTLAPPTEEPSASPTETHTATVEPTSEPTLPPPTGALSTETAESPEPIPPTPTAPPLPEENTEDAANGNE